MCYSAAMRRIPSGTVLQRVFRSSRAGSGWHLRQAGSRAIQKGVPALLIGGALLLAGCRSSQVWFSNDADLTTALTDHMGTATDTLDVAVYTFTSEEIRDAIIDADSRGVAVRVVIDVWATNDAIASSLEDAGVPTKRSAGYDNSQGDPGIMHHKFAVVDQKSVATGSFNFTMSADNKNYENLLVVSDPALAGQYTNAFDELWKKAE
jgi:phosphatidylserine/phosphatidylglycerophosphate/cardiolipin synthase-like enzyme